MAFLTPYRRGLFLTFLGILIITPDSLLILMAEQSPANLLFWRNSMLLPFLVPLLLIYRHKIFNQTTPVATLPKQLWRKTKQFYPLMIFFPITSAFFILGTQHNTVANNLIIVGSSPLIGAMLTAFYLKKKVPWDNWLATIGVLVGISLVMFDSLLDAKLFGAMCSLGAALFLALHYNFLQGRHLHPLLIVLFIVLGNVILSLPFVAWGTTNLWQFSIMFINAVLTIALSFGLTSYAARWVSTEEILLIFMLEILIGPLPVWWVLGQTPSNQVVIGGLIVLVVVSTWIWHRIKSQSAKPSLL
ncbi:MAG: DMT family transporter [Alphaproteobacteria bacterium]